MTDRPEEIEDLDLFEDPANTREQILSATYRALREYGYAELTIQRIGEEFEKSQSLVYHHYEDKDDLVLACLEYMLEEFEEALVGEEIDEPREALETLLAATLSTDAAVAHRDFRRTLIDLRAQVSHDPAFATHFERSDRLIESYVRSILDAGVEDGTFRDVDTERVAAWLYTTLTGAFYRDATDPGGQAWHDAVRHEVELHLESRVYA